jgi:hypothetical protein
MYNRDPRGLVTTENAVASVYIVAGPADTSSCPFTGSDAMEEGRGPASIETQDHGSPASDHHEPLAPVVMQDATGTVMPGVNCTCGKDRGIRNRQRGYMFVVDSGACPSIAGATGPFGHADGTVPQHLAMPALALAG